MSVKSAVYVLWCVGVSLGHPVQYPLRPEPYSFEQAQRPSIFGNPSFLPEDVELVNSQGKPIQYKPSINDVELFMPSNGKPIPFPKEEMSDMISGMGREQSVPLMIAKDGSRMPMMIEMGQPRVVSTLVNRQGPNEMPIMGQERVGMMPMIIRRDIPEMMSMMMEKQGPHVMPMHMEREASQMIPSEGAHMMPLSLVRDGSQMMPMNNEGSHMMPMHMEREASQMMPSEGAHMMPLSLVRDGSQMMPMDNEGSHMMPMTIHREHLTMPVMMDEKNTLMMMHGRLKRQEISTTSNPSLNHTQNRNVLEKEFLSLLDKTVDNLEKQNIIMYPVNTKEIIIIDNQATDNQSKDPSMKLFDQNIQQNTTLNALDFQNEITNEELQITDKVINEQQKPTTMRVFEFMNENKHQQLPETDEVMNDESTEKSQNTKDHQNEQTSMNGEPSKEISPEIKDEQDKQNATINIFDAINSMNEVKHQQLAEADKIMNEEPVKEKITELDQDKSSITFDDISSTDKSSSNGQPSSKNIPSEQPIITFATETSTISLFDSQKESKNQDSSVVDRTTSKSITINELTAAQMKLMREMEKINKLFLEQDLAEIHKLLENDVAPMRPMNAFDSKNQQNNETTSVLETSTTSEIKTQTDKPDEPVRVTSLSPDLIITEVLQEINYGPIDPTFSQNQTIERKASEEQDNAATDIVPTSPSPKASEYLDKVPNILELTRLLNIINGDFSNVGTEPPRSRQNEMFYHNNFNNAANLAISQPNTIPLAENSQPQYRYMYSNYPAVYYQ